MFKKLTQSLVLAAALTFVATPVVSASGGNPAGNNGFVKINNELAPDHIPNNHPHVSCEFSVEFYNYEKGDYNATVKFELQAPTVGDGYSLDVTSGNLKPFIGKDAAGGGNDLDASEVYKLDFTGKPHDKQGYHVKLTINAPKSKGSDKKHKVFWVSPCDENKDESNEQVLGSTTPTTLPKTGAPATLLAVSAVSATGYAIRYFQLKRSARD